MLRIAVHDNNNITNFTIEGKLTAPTANELERCWQIAAAAEPPKPIVVNLTAVTFIDSECRDLLTRMRRHGVKLVPHGCLMKSIVEQIEAELDTENRKSAARAE